MARAAAKKKRDIPPLYMLVADGGRLDPAFQHDQERLMSFRKGTRLVVTVEPDGSRRGVRKWHAIIGKAVKNSLLPWVTVSAADEAIRLALDLYEPKKANDGSWHRITQSLNDLSDEELDEQIEQMTALIYRISGVDPADFQRELAGAGDERFKSDYDRPAADNDAGAASNSSGDSSPPPDDLPASDGEDSSAASIPDPESAGGAATPSQAKATEDNASTTALEGSAGPGVASRLDAGRTASGAGVMKSDASASESSGEEEKATGEDLTGLSASPAAELTEEDRTWLRDGARMMLAAQPEPSAEAKDVLFRQVKSIIMLMPKNASAEARNRMEQIKQHCMSVCRGEADLDVPLVARTALSTVDAITPQPVTMGRKAQ